MVLVVVLAAGSFVGNASVSAAEPSPAPNAFVDGGDQSSPGVHLHGGDDLAARHDDSFYRYSAGVDMFVGYGIVLGLVLLIAYRLPRKETFALFRPKSWPRTIGLTAGVLVAAYLLTVLVAAAIGPAADTDQGIPVFWDGSRAGQFVLSFIGIAVLVPVVEELTFRGLGFSLLSSKFGPRIALAGTTLLFALGHGFLIALPLFLIAGLALGWLRMRTGSIYPGMLAHGALNGSVTLIAVTLG